MAVGDSVFWGAHNVASNGTTDLQPGSGIEVVVQSIEAQTGKALEIYRTRNGTDYVLLDTLPAGGIMSGLTLRCSNTDYVRIKNVSGGTAGNYAAGVVTK